MREEVQKEYRFSEHFLFRLKRRRIELEKVMDTLQNPDDIQPSSPKRYIYQKTFFDIKLNKETLLRVVVEQEGSLFIILTAYTTTKLLKYRGKPK